MFKAKGNSPRVIIDVNKSLEEDPGHPKARKGSKKQLGI
jgi:hypothetical protein